MNLCTKLQKQVLDLEEAKTAQAKEIASLKKRVKQLEKRRKSRTSGLKSSTAGEVVTTANVKVTTASAPTTTIDEFTLAQTLIKIKAAKPKVAKGQRQGNTGLSLKNLKKKDQIAIDEEVVRNLEALLQAKLEEEERLSRLKEEEANIDYLNHEDTNSYDEMLTLIGSANAN
ncbi:hypothetical protein Tco_0778317 [Tanacetum coccineum]